MPYLKTVWSDRVVARPMTYTLQSNGDGTTTLIPSEGQVTQSGTAITSQIMNNLETQYDKAMTDVSTTYIPLSGDSTKSGQFTINSGINTIPIIIDNDNGQIQILNDATDNAILSLTSDGSATRNLSIEGFNGGNIATLNLKATTTVASGILNATTLQEGGTNLSTKYSLATHNHDTVYLKLSGGTVSGTLNATTLQEGGTNLSAKYSLATHNHDASYLQLVGGTLSGQLTINYHGSGITLKSPNTDDTALAYIEFKNSATTPLRYGYVGKGGNSKHLMLRSDLGDLMLETPNGTVIPTSGLRNLTSYFEMGDYTNGWANNKLQTYFDSATREWRMYARDVANASVTVTLAVTGSVKANGVTLTSKRETKKNIAIYQGFATQKIIDTPIQTFQYENDDRNRNRVGVILEESPSDIIDEVGEGIDLYSMVAISWKAIQELTKEIEILKRGKPNEPI